MRILFAALILGCSSGESSTPTTTDAGTDTATSSEDSAPIDTGVADTAKPDPWDGGMPSMECVAHCECMKTTCSTYSGYPYKTTTDCTNHCGTFDAAQMKCWTYWCTEAVKASSTTKDHLCQHAWGTWGLEECPK